MGRGNACTHGDYEGLYYIDYDNYTTYICDEDGNLTEERDYDYERMLLEDDIELLKLLFKRRFTSFVDCDEWINRDEKAILENDLFYIAVEDNEWSLAVKLIQKDSYDYNNTGLQAKHFQNYLEGLKECLFELYPEIGCYDGAWTHRTIKRPSNWKSNHRLWRCT